MALDYGRIEGDCIRCPYHGWLYDETGQYLEQPAEPAESAFHQKVKLKTYPTQEVSGLVYGYLGPQPAPVLPLFDVLRMEDGVKEIQIVNVSANWFNHVENIVDVSHLAWLHGYSFPAYGAKKVEYHWDRKDYGVDNVMEIEGVDDTHVSCYGFPTVNRFAGTAVGPNGELSCSMIYRVPVDDESMLLYFFRFHPNENKSVHVSHRETTLGEYAPMESDWWGIAAGDQDRMAVEQQGVVADRPNEHLGASDGGIILMRQMMRESLAAIEKGEDPACVIRDSAKQNVDFPQRATMMDQIRDDVDYRTGFTRDAEKAMV